MAILIVHQPYTFPNHKTNNLGLILQFRVTNNYHLVGLPDFESILHFYNSQFANHFCDFFCFSDGKDEHFMEKKWGIS